MLLHSTAAGDRAVEAHENHDLLKSRLYWLTETKSKIWMSAEEPEEHYMLHSCFYAVSMHLLGADCTCVD